MIEFFNQLAHGFGIPGPAARQATPRVFRLPRRAAMSAIETGSASNSTIRLLKESWIIKPIRKLQ